MEYKKGIWGQTACLDMLGRSYLKKDMTDQYDE
jgi:hypothetical protein